VGQRVCEVSQAYSHNARSSRKRIKRELTSSKADDGAMSISGGGIVDTGRSGGRVGAGLRV
jgi:hypothetical protein